MVVFSVPGNPVGKERARTVRNGNKSISYTPAKTKDYERLVKLCFMKARCEYIGDKPIKAIITAYYPVPRSDSKKLKELKLQEQILPCIKPDCDNIAKIILDSLNGLAYADDKQVVSLTVTKAYAETPSVCVVLEVWNG